MLGNGAPDMIEVLAATYSLLDNLFQVIDRNDLWDDEDRYVLEDGTEITRAQYRQWEELRGGNDGLRIGNV